MWPHGIALSGTSTVSKRGVFPSRPFCPIRPKCGSSSVLSLSVGGALAAASGDHWELMIEPLGHDKGETSSSSAISLSLSFVFAFLTPEAKV